MRLGDEWHLAEGLRFNLEADGHRVELEGDGDEALERLLSAQARYDAVIAVSQGPAQAD